MRLERDEQADAVYVRMSSEPYSYGKDLDDERRVDYGSDDAPIGVELLCVSNGVNVAGLPFADEIAALLEGSGIPVHAMAPVQVKQGSTLKLVTWMEVAASQGTASADYSVKVLKGEDEPWTSTSHSYVTMLK